MNSSLVIVVGKPISMLNRLEIMPLQVQKEISFDLADKNQIIYQFLYLESLRW